MMAEAGIILAAQGSFIYNEADGYPDLLNEEQEKTFMPLRSCLDAGITLALSTDMPSAHHNPFWGMYSVVTRKGMHGHCLGTEECITVNEALRAMTLNGAYMSFEEKEKGSLLPGMLADIALLDHDLTNIHEEEIRNVKVLMTLIDGEIMFEA